MFNHQTFNYLRHGQVIFVRGCHFHRFANELFPKIRHKFVLISHNSDFTIELKEEEGSNAKCKKYN